MTRHRKGVSDRDAVFALQAQARLARTAPPAPGPVPADPGPAGQPSVDIEPRPANRPREHVAVFPTQQHPATRPEPVSAAAGHLVAEPVDPLVWAGESLFDDTGNATEGDGRRWWGRRRG